MNSRKLYYVMIGLVILMVGGFVSIVIAGNNYLGQQADKLFAAKLDQKSLNEQQTALIKAKRDLQQYQELRSIAKTIVPQDKDQARAVREIVRIAEESGVSLESITFDDSNLGRAPVAPAPAQGGEPTTSDQTPAQPSSASQSSAPPVTQAQPVTGIPGLFQVPVTIISTKDGNQFDNFILFLSKLENNRRTAQVEKVNITTGRTQTGQPFINFSLTVNIFVKP